MWFLLLVLVLTGQVGWLPGDGLEQADADDQREAE
jgi:hypothetical protein